MRNVAKELAFVGIARRLRPISVPLGGLLGLVDLRRPAMMGCLLVVWDRSSLHKGTALEVVENVGG